MQTNSTPKYLIIGVILAWALYSLLPTWQYYSLSEQKKEELRLSGELSVLESRIIQQGLDLKGGMYIVLEADIPTLMVSLASIKDERLDSIIQSSSNQIVNSNNDFFEIFEEKVKEDGLKLSRYYYEFGSSLEEILNGLRDESNDAIDRVLEILQNRIDQFGVSEPTIQKQGNHRIVVDLAGIQDSD